MADTSEDPIDSARTHRPRVGESFKDGRLIPGFVLLGVGVVLLFLALAATALGRAAAGTWLAVAALLLGLTGGVLIYLERRRNARVLREKLES